MMSPAPVRDGVAVIAYLLALVGLLWAAAALWRSEGWWVLVLLVPAWLLLKAPEWYTGHHGINQWPDPHGRYYKEWWNLRGYDGGDYYAWLHRRLGDRDPWRTWARWERESSEEYDT